MYTHTMYTHVVCTREKAARHCVLFKHFSLFFQEFFNYLHPLLQLSVQLLEVYRDTPEVIGVILELFALTAENYIVFLKGVT